MFLSLLSNIICLVINFYNIRFSKIKTVENQLTNTLNKLLMKSKRIIFVLLAIVFITSCQKDDDEFLDFEKTKTNNKSVIGFQAENQSVNCTYIYLTAVIKAGSYSGCELFDKMNEKKEEYSQEIEPGTGCPVYLIPDTQIFNCMYMDELVYIEQWKMLASYGTCGGNFGCPGSETRDIELDDDFN